LWTTLMRRAMSRDFSWEAAARRYEQLYQELAGATEQAAA